jgi:hypothetical protein
MIFVSRNAAAAGAVLAALNKPVKGKNKTEVECARDYYAQRPAPAKAYPFARYKEHDVCTALDLLYHEKCAYCESSYRAVDSRDVEHFRPKGGVAELPAHPGYWWLAAEWSNLLPSCPPCNQLRKQTLFKPGVTEEELARARTDVPLGRSGKANSFPMRAPARWVTAEGGRLDREDPLLINPSARDPHRHLRWVFDVTPGAPIWSASWITALLTPRPRRGGDDEYGAASITVYGLNRQGLVRERMERLKLMQAASRAVVDALIDVGASTARERPLRLERLRARRADLDAFADADKPYAAMAQAFIERFDSEVTQAFRPR